jgi:hypothetical protein
MIEGRKYRTKKGTYRGVKIENVRPGQMLDWGRFAAIDPREPNQGPNTVNVRFQDGMHYTEGSGAIVRVWED